MPELKRSFEAAGFRNVRTVLSSGNVIFDASSSDERTLERCAEEAIEWLLTPGRWNTLRALRVLRWYDQAGATEAA